MKQKQLKTISGLNQENLTYKPNIQQVNNKNKQQNERNIKNKVNK